MPTTAARLAARPGIAVAALYAATVAVCSDMYITAQAVAPAYVNATARSAKGGASALYLTSDYVGGTLGAALPGVAWQAVGWAGVAAVCLAALGAAMLALWALCGG